MKQIYGVLFMIFGVVNYAADHAINYFTLLPEDILSHIARYLPFNVESDEECIERIKNSAVLKKEVIQKHITPFQLGMGRLPTLMAYSIDQSKAIFIERSLGMRFAFSTIGVVDIQNDVKINNIWSKSSEYEEILKKQMHSIRKIALSHTGSMLAELHKQSKNYSVKKQSSTIFQDALVIRKREGSSTYIVAENAKDHRDYAMGFNKQSTKIIVVYQTSGGKDKHKSYLLVTLKEHTKKSTKTFANYMFTNRICQTWFNAYKNEVSSIKT